MSWAGIASGASRSEQSGAPEPEISERHLALWDEALTQAGGDEVRARQLYTGLLDDAIARHTDETARAARRWQRDYAHTLAELERRERTTLRGAAVVSALSFLLLLFGVLAAIPRGDVTLALALFGLGLPLAIIGELSWRRHEIAADAVAAFRRGYKP